MQEAGRRSELREDRRDLLRLRQHPRFLRRRSERSGVHPAETGEPGLHAGVLSFASEADPVAPTRGETVRVLAVGRDDARASRVAGRARTELANRLQAPLRRRAVGRHDALSRQADASLRRHVASVAGAADGSDGTGIICRTRRISQATRTCIRLSRGADGIGGAAVLRAEARGVDVAAWLTARRARDACASMTDFRRPTRHRARACCSRAVHSSVVRVTTSEIALDTATAHREDDDEKAGA